MIQADEDLWGAGVGKFSGSRGDVLCRTMTFFGGFRPPRTLCMKTKLDMINHLGISLYLVVT